MKSSLILLVENFWERSNFNPSSSKIKIQIRIFKLWDIGWNGTIGKYRIWSNKHRNALLFLTTLIKQEILSWEIIFTGLVFKIHSASGLAGRTCSAFVWRPSAFWNFYRPQSESVQGRPTSSRDPWSAWKYDSSLGKNQFKESCPRRLQHWKEQNSILQSIFKIQN